MNVLIVLCALVACTVAKPYVGLAYSAPTSYSYSTSVVSVSKPAPLAYAAHAPLAYAAAPAFAPVAYAAAPAPAPFAYAAAPAPAVVPAPAPAPAPVAYAAVPAPAVVAAPVPVTYAAAPAPALVAAPAPVTYTAAPAVVAAAAVKSQYHAQNEIGEASYGHAEPGQTHNAVQDVHGNKIGSFSYVNPVGDVLRTDYVADGAGYRVASNALPAAPIVTPIDTPEVAAAKEAFHHEYAAKAAETHARRRRSAVLIQTPASTAPLTYAPTVYAAPPAPVAYAAAPAPIAYAAAPAPLAYTLPSPISYAPAPISYAPAPAHLAYTGPAPAPTLRHATLTTVVNTPGHAVSYRVD